MQHHTQVTILQELMRQLDAGQNIDAGVQYRMPTKDYVCTDRAQQEQQHFFRDHPHFVGLSNDLPENGCFYTVDELGIPILTTRDQTGRFRAFLNACRHRSARVVSETRGKKSVLMCPFHHWSYGVSGELINVPNQDHFGDIDKACMGLVELPAEERNGMLWVHPNPAASLNLDELLGDLNAEFATHPAGDLIFAGETTIQKRLNWKLANDTFGETYHFGKLHKDTLGQLYYGNNLHLTLFDQHHRFVTANHGIDAMREEPIAQWHIARGTFVLYYLFPNVQFLINPESATLIRIYPVPGNPSESVTKISFYYSQAAIDAGAAEITKDDEASVYDRSNDRGGSLQANLEVFKSTIEDEDYVMGEMQQKAAESGLLDHIIFGRNEPALHHFHSSFKAALGEPPLERILS